MPVSMSHRLEFGDDVDDDDALRDQMDYDEDNPREEAISEVGEDDGEINDGEENNEEVDGAAAAAAAKPKKLKRIIKNPQPKLNCQRLKTARGLSALPGQFKDFKFQGRGHEHQDLSQILRRLEHWAHRLYPRLQFADFVEQMEKLGKKQECKVLLKRIRLDMHEPEEEAGVVGGEDDPTNRGDPDEPPANAFDDLIGDQGSPPSPPPPPRPLPRQEPVALTEDQIERMERNRQLAMEKRKARLLEQQATKVDDC